MPMNFFQELLNTKKTITTRNDKPMTMTKALYASILATKLVISFSRSDFLRLLVSRTSAWLAALSTSYSITHWLVMSDNPNTRRPQCLAAMTSWAVLIPEKKKLYL